MITMSCATLSVEGFTFQGFQRTFAMLPAAGYRRVEFNLWDPRCLTPASLRDLRARCGEHGLTAGSVHGPAIGHGDEEGGKEFSHVFWMLHAAKSLGCHTYCATAYRRGSMGGVERIIDILRLVMPVAEDLGLRVALENHQGSNLETIADYARIFDAIPSPSLGCCLDTGHFEASGIAPLAVADALGTRVTHLHLKENRGFGQKHFVRFGEGTTDHHALLRALAEAGYAGDAVVELSPQRDRPHSLDDLRLPLSMFAALAKP